METGSTSTSGPAGMPEELNDLQNYLETFNKEIEQNGQENFVGNSIDTGAQEPTAAGDSGSTTIFFKKEDLEEVVDKDQNASHSADGNSGIIPHPVALHLASSSESMGTQVLGDKDSTITITRNDLGQSVNLSEVQTQMVQLQSAVEGEERKISIQQPGVKQTFMKLDMPSGGATGLESKILQVVSIDGQEHVQLVDAGADNQELQIPTVSAANLVDAGLIEQTIASSSNIDGTDPVAVLASVAANTSSVNQLQSETISIPALGQEYNQAQLVALQNSSDSSQPQLVAVQTSGTVGSLVANSIENLEAAVGGTPNSIVLNTGGNNYQTVTIVPSEVNQSGEMNYVLIVSQPDKEKEEEVEAKDCNMEQVIEEMVDEDGVTRHVIKITQKKYDYPGSSQSVQLMCNFCNYTSSKRYLLMRHMKSHSDDRPHRCNICNRGFKTMASLQNHVNTHTGTRPHKCKDCESAFTTSGELVRHTRYKHTLEKPHKCSECDYASVELSKLKRHIRSHTGERPFQCPHCNYASPDTYKLKRHMRIHTGEKPYECDVCHAHFTQSNSLKAHKLIHSGNKPVFQCELCPTTCGRKTDLKIHMLKLHSSEKPLVCKKCDETFPDRYSYKLHMKCHEGEKCFKCDLCDYAAQSLRHLETHMLVHTGEKPFECGDCEQTFRQKQLLKRHIQLYHTPDSECSSTDTQRDKIFECMECDRTFTHRGNLLRHMTTHEMGSQGSPDKEQQETKTREIFGSPLTAEQLLQGSLLNEMREGKLGSTPKIVIVHPDGRVEEVTSRLQSMAQEKAIEEVMLNIDEMESSTQENKETKVVSEENNQVLMPVETSMTMPHPDSMALMGGMNQTSLHTEHQDDNDEERRDVQTQVALETDSEVSNDSSNSGKQIHPLDEDSLPVDPEALNSRKRKEDFEDSGPSKKLCAS